jgi:ribulose-5-phosphate 4-epimerase/fuculose-1-phosphate aldolase
MNFDSPEVKELKATVATANRVLAFAGLATGPMAYLGHASARIPNTEYIVMKGRGYAVDTLAKMQAEDMLVLDLEANVVDGPRGVIPQNEVKMHTRLYAARKDVGGITHVHPRFCIILSIVGKKIVPVCNEGLILTQPGVPVYPSNELICTDAQGDRVAKRMGARNAILLRGHGAVTAGSGVEQATLNMLDLEEQARMNYYTYLLSRGAAGARIPQGQARAYVDFIPVMPDLPVLKKAAAERGHRRIPLDMIRWNGWADAVR